MTMELEGKVGLVTGGTSGIGQDTAVLFAKAGAKVVVAGRREPEGKKTIELIRAAGGDGLFVKTDVSKAGEVDSLIRQVVERFGRLDIAFNNAGIEGVWVPIINQSEKDWDQTIDINLKGVWLCLKYEIRQMRKQGGGRIVMNTSRVTLGKISRTLYSASKGAMQAMARTWALELARDGITVNCVAPGPIATSVFWKNNPPDSDETRNLVASVPVGRMGTPEDVANAVSFFCDEKASFVTGQTLFVCGGVTVG